MSTSGLGNSICPPLAAEFVSAYMNIAGIEQEENNVKEVNDVDIKAVYDAMAIHDSGLKKGTPYACGCGEDHKVNDEACVVFFRHKPWHVDCLADVLTGDALALEMLLDHPKETVQGDTWKDITPERSANGIWWCCRSDSCGAFSRLKSGEGYCVAMGASVTAPKPCVPWLIALVRAVRDLGKRVKP
jgi:hypothetical protein